MQKYKLILEESTDVSSEILTESNGSKKYVIKGIFSTPDTRNRNGRIYPKSLWESAINDWKQRADRDPKYKLCELEHPPRAEIDMWEAVAKIRKLEFTKDGKIYGEAEILDNDSNPKIGQLKALIEAGIPIGVSSRGLGRLGKNNLVEEFKLQTYDIVANPSDYNANLEGFTESMVSEKDYILTESGEWICDENGCRLEEGTSSGDIAQDSQKSKKCNTLAEQLLEAFNSVIKPKTPQYTEKELKAMVILGMISEEEASEYAKLKKEEPSEEQKEKEKEKFRKEQDKEREEQKDQKGEEDKDQEGEEQKDRESEEDKEDKEKNIKKDEE